MSKRTDIIDGKLAPGRKYGLVYTKKCGWIDLGHANPAGGATELWKRVRDETGNDPFNKPGDTTDSFVIMYDQQMGSRSFKVGLYKRYQIKRGLALHDKKAIALSIFLEVSKAFEGWQNNWFWSAFTDSGFSAEDLVSDLVGFYRAVDPATDYIGLCEPVEKDIALQIWDKYGAVGSNKNYSAAPYLYPIPGSSLSGPMSVPLPGFLTTITPAATGPNFQELKE
jgi:hypothetical protein